MSAPDPPAVFWQSFLRTSSPTSWSRCLLKTSKAADMKKSGTLIFGIIGWVIAIIIFFPIPAAYKMSFFTTLKTRGRLLSMLSTKMMPAVGVLVPIYIIFKNLGLLDNVFGLIIIYTLMNLPIAVWMSYTYFCEIPAAILEAGRIDGATLWQEIWHLLRPMTLPGLSSTGLILIIFAWNEAFWRINLTSANAAPLTAFIASYSSPEGLFWAKLSAASLLAVAPIMVLGWLTQKQLVQGLTFGAVK